MTASCSVRPFISRNSSTLSNVPESLQSGSTIGNSFDSSSPNSSLSTTPCAGVHPVHVAAERVDLAVVAHEPQRLGAVPRGERVGREPRVDHRQVAGVVGSSQVGIVLEELLGREHALVDDHLGRQRADVEHLRLRERRVAAEPVAGLLADQIELPLEGVAREALAGGDHQLLDVRLAGFGGRADVGLVGFGRHLAPADQPLALLLR